MGARVSAGGERIAAALQCLPPVLRGVVSRWQACCARSRDPLLEPARGDVERLEVLREPAPGVLGRRVQALSSKIRQWRMIGSRTSSRWTRRS